MRVYVDRAKKSFFDTRTRDFSQNECLREIRPFDLRENAASRNECNEDNCDDNDHADNYNDVIEKSRRTILRVARELKSPKDSVYYKEADDSEESRVLSWRLAESHRQNLLSCYGKLAIVEPKYFPARIEK